MQGNRGLIHAIGLALAGLIAVSGAANAGILNADVGLNPLFEQTGPTTFTDLGGFFSGRAFVNSPSDYTGGTLTYGGPGSPQGLSFVPADTAWEYQSSVDPSFSDLQSLYPAGPYTFDLTGGEGPSSVSINYQGDAFSNRPELAAASFSALQGLNAGDSITLDFNTMDVSPNATDSFVFFSVFDSSGAAVVSDSFLPSDTTSVSIGGGTLKAGQSYTFDLLFSDRIGGMDGDIFTTQVYDTHTSGSFATAAGAVPEPSTWAMLLIGFAGLGFAGYRSTRKATAG
jgi:PEP-CTERM motif